MIRKVLLAARAITLAVGAPSAAPEGPNFNPLLLGRRNGLLSRRNVRLWPLAAL